MSRTFDAPDVGDETLLKEFLAGEPDAFAALYVRYAAPVAGFICNRKPFIANDELDDLVQDVFTEALALIGDFEEADYEGDNPFRQWLFNIPASNVLFQDRKRHWRHREVYLRSVDGFVQQLREESIPNDAPQALPEQMQKAIEQLRPHYRQAIELYYFEGLPLGAVATVMGRDYQSVRYLLRAALGELREPDKPKMVRGERRTALLMAACALLAERPARSITNGDIAKMAGCADGLIRYYFGSKQALFAEAMGAPGVAA